MPASISQAARRHTTEHYALNGLPSDISGQCFYVYGHLMTGSVINPIGRPGSNGGNRSTPYSVSFAGEHRGQDRYRLSHPVDREYDVNRHRSSSKSPYLVMTMDVKATVIADIIVANLSALVNAVSTTSLHETVTTTAADPAAVQWTRDAVTAS